MGYFNSFRNTFFVDLLEIAGLVKLEPYPHKLENTINAGQKSEKNVDLERGEESNDSTEKAAESDKNRNDDEVDPFVVGFVDDNDPEHPLNWPNAKTVLFVTEVMVLTCVTYMGSSIYTPGQEEIQREFGIGHVVGTLNLSVYVLGYGLGPLVFSPLSEFARIGRQRLYIVSLFLFCMLQIGCALVRNIAGLVILRFITGILCSPSLSTGGASVGDVIIPEHVPIFIGLWGLGAVAAPVTGPLLGASMVVAEDWRWIFWLLTWISAAVLIVLIFFFPETSADNILYRRCQRIKRAKNDDRYYTPKERQEATLAKKDFLITALYRPVQIILEDPIVLALDGYIALCYGTFYLFFEAFPIVFVGVYHFTLIELGLSYLGFCVGCVFAYAACVAFMVLVVGKRIRDNTMKPEIFLILAMAASWCLPLSLFLFGWAASVHWTLPMLAEIFFVLCVFNLFQATFAYLAMSYPKFLASVYAGNGLMRAGFACAFPLFGRAMYNGLAIKGYPVAWGSSILGFFSVGLAVIPFVLYRYGPFLRSKSRFTG